MPDEIIYGINPVLEALRSERQGLNKILLAEGREGGSVRLIRQLAREKGIPVQISPKEALDRLAGGGHHQGILGFTAASSYPTWDDLLGRVRAAHGKTIVLILDSIEDPQNLGSLIRTAEACGVKGVILPKDRAAGITPAVVKASAGAVAEKVGWCATPPTDAERDRLRAIVAAANERLKLAGDLLDYDELFVADDELVFDEKAFDKRIRSAPDAPALLAALRADLAKVEPFDVQTLERLCQEFVAARGLGLGAIVHALRVAVSGKPVGFGLFDILAMLGRERVVARIDRALARLAPGS